MREKKLSLREKKVESAGNFVPRGHRQFTLREFLINGREAHDSRVLPTIITYPKQHVLLIPHTASYTGILKIPITTLPVTWCCKIFYFTGLLLYEMRSLSVTPALHAGMPRTNQGEQKWQTLQWKFLPGN